MMRPGLAVQRRLKPATGERAASPIYGASLVSRGHLWPGGLARWAAVLEDLCTGVGAGLGVPCGRAAAYHRFTRPGDGSPDSS